jgi:hypothetical protein
MVIAQGNQYRTGDGFPADAQGKVQELVAAGHALVDVAFAPDGHWLVVLENNAYWHNGINSGLTTAWGNLAAQGMQITDVRFAPAGDWIILGSNGYFANSDLDGAYPAIGAGIQAGNKLKSVTFTPAGEWLVLFEGNKYTKSAHFPADCAQKLTDLINAKFTIDDITFDPEGAWAIVADNGYYFSGGTGGAMTAAQQLSGAGHEVTRVAFSLVEVTQPQFPIQAEQRTDLSGCGGHMDTTVTIDAQGHMNAVTHIWEDTDLRGFHGGAVVVLVDANNKPLWASPTEVLGVDGRWIGVSDRTVGWTATVPASVLALARGIAIYQTWDPTNVAGVIAQWLSALSTDSALVANIVKSIAIIVATV